jgi:arylsulfatase A-like enzyme
MLFTRRRLLGAALVFTTLLAPSAAQAERPHIVVFLADDLGWNGVGYHGGPVETPNIDRLADGGARLERFYALPLCTPSRAALLTGRYPMRLGLQFGVLRPWNAESLDHGERLLSEALRDAGYETAITGKWHLGHADEESLPTRRGFDHQYGCFTGWIDYLSHQRDGIFDWNRDDRPLNERGHVTDLIAAECVRLIDERDEEKPLFLYVPFTAPHGPLTPPDEYLERYASIKDDDFRSYAGLVTHMDDAIGRVLTALGDNEMLDDTLVLFLSDNGGQSDVGVLSNRPLRGHKGVLFEGGVHVPAVVSWPGHIEGGRVIEDLVHIVDFFPTLVGVAGGSTDAGRPLDGLDLMPMLLGSNGAPSGPREFALLNTNHRRSVIVDERWKLLVAHEGAANPGNMLFDLANDPYEKSDIAEEHPEEVARLGAVLEAYRGAAAPELMTKKSERLPRGFKFPKRWGHATARDKRSRKQKKD